MSETMTPREVVRRTIRFQDPPRYPLYFGRFGVDDTVDVFDFFLKDEDGIDPWGQRWTVHPDFPSIGVILEHPVQSLSDVARLTPPDPVYYAARVRESLAALTPEQRDKYRFVATSSGIWERAHDLRGTAQFMEDMLLDPSLPHALVEFCTDFWVAFLRELQPVAGELDALYMFDDWGTQQDTWISPELWRRFFAGPYRRIIEAAHANDMDFWLHSCGKVTGLIPDFIEVGMDLLNPYQSKTCGYEYVAEHFAGKVAFLTTVDAQSTLTRGTPDQVREECRRLEKWGTPHGGLIPASYSYDTPEENERIVLDYFTTHRPGG